MKKACLSPLLFFLTLVVLFAAPAMAADEERDAGVVKRALSAEEMAAQLAAAA